MRPVPKEARALERALRAQLAGEVRFDPGTRALYATDASNYRQVPIGVVKPVSRADVLAALAVCREFEAPVLARGAGTSLAGQACNVAVVIDMSRSLDRLISIDPERRLARVEPGIVLDRLNAAALAHGLTFGPDPATHAQCTLGGMIGNNACGVRSLATGKTVDNVEELEVARYDGSVLKVGATSPLELEATLREGGPKGALYAGLVELLGRHAAAVRSGFPKLRRRVSGYNLDELLPERGFQVARSLVGSEGTLALVLEATLRLVPRPAARTLLVLGYPDVFLAADAVPELLEARPQGLEGMDSGLVRAMARRGLFAAERARLPPGQGFLLVELAGESADEVAERARRLAARERGRAQAVIVAEPESMQGIWRVREAGAGALSLPRAPGARPFWSGFEDSAVPPEELGGYLRELRALLERCGYEGAFYGHFGEGCLHVRIDFDLETRAGIARFRGFLEEAADLVLAHGGSISGEHGDGQARAFLLERMFGSELLGAFRELKRLWDPELKMNPGKVVDAREPDADLRLAPRARRPPGAETAGSGLRLAADEGSLRSAALRCVGVGKCVRGSGGAMCPSYMVTRDEQHSTRGRAHLLFEMLEGELLEGGFEDPHLKQALDLCLGCKACKSECPAGVDIARLKTEFLYRRHRTRRRPLRDHAFGRVETWARLGSRAPALFNAALGAPWLGAAARRWLGIAAPQGLPRLAMAPFHARRASGAAGAAGPRPQVLFWLDTFSRYFVPRRAHAAIAALEALGYSVELPEAAICCARPLFELGMLDEARRQLERTLAALAGPLARGLPVVGIEPSCVALFRDDLLELFPGDPRAQALSAAACTLAEQLDRDAALAALRPLPGRPEALVQPHCQQAAVIGLDADRRLFEALGLRARLVDAGCCGMAGSFGLQRESHAVALACAERQLLPELRAARSESLLVVSDGFSCSEQIRQAGGRRALHGAELLAAALGVLPGSSPRSVE